MKTLNPYSVNKWLLGALPGLALCLIIACSDDDKKDNPIIPDSLSIASFSPSQGEASTEITVIGTGFSTVSSENTVTLGTTPVSLNLAEAGKLKFNVPEGASSGKISVSVGTESVTSSSSFTVEEPNPVPLITGFSPVEGEWGDQITITGTGFSETDNMVTINGVVAETINKEGNQLTVEIGDNTRTGKIVVTNSYDESGESESDLTVFHGRWTQIADFGGDAVAGASSFSLDGLGYVTMGISDLPGITKIVWVYDPETKLWSQKANVYGGTARYGSTSFVINNTPYVGLGSFFGELQSDFWKYDSSNDSWTVADTFDGTQRTGAVAFSIGSTGYLGTGDDQDNENLKDFWRYDGTSWTKLEDFGGVARYGAVGFSVGNKGYIGTGTTGSMYLKDFWEYDHQEDVWTQKADLNGASGIARANAIGFGISYFGYIGLGVTEGNTYLNDLWEFDPDNNRWAQVAIFPGIARRLASVIVIDNKAYVGLGVDEDGNSLKDFWVFDPGN